MAAKRITSALVCALLLLFCFSGCSGGLASDNNILQAPRPDGEVSKIQAALKRASVTNYTLKTPKYGEFRSAFVLRDLNGDGKDEAVAFYSTKSGKTETLHFSVILKKGRRWEVASDTALAGSDIEKVNFGDMNGDGTLEVCIAVSIYGSPEKRLSVYKISGDIPVKWYEGSYSDYLICDMNGDSCDDLVVFTIDTIEKIASCTLLVSNGSALNRISSVRLDSGITSIKEITNTKVDGAPALFVDAQNGQSSYFTEIVSFKNGALCVPLYEQSRQSSLLTSRYQNLSCRDIDYDGELEIPCMTALPTDGNEQNVLYLTDWKAYSGGQLRSKELSVISKEQQYKIVIKDMWIGNFSCLSANNDGMDFYDYSAKDGLKSCLFQLCAVSSGGYRSDEFRGWFTVQQNYKTVYLAKITAEGTAEGITEKTVSECFRDNISED